MWKWLERLSSRQREVSLSEAIRVLPLDVILEVVFFKRDEITTDLICCEVTTSGDVWHFHEDWPGWRSLITHLEALPGWRADWLAGVSQPPFAHSRTVAFKR